MEDALPRNTKFLIAQKKEMENIRSVRIQNVKPNSMRWAAKPERLKGYLNNGIGEREKMCSCSPIVDEILKIED